MKRRAIRIAVALAAVAALAAARLTGRPPARAERPALTCLPPSPDDVVLWARLEAKGRAARDVAAGRLSLPAAAALFRDLDASCGPPPVWPVRDAFPDARSEEEAYCRSVIAWAAIEAPRGQAADLTRRLEAELDALLRDGPMRLPAPSRPARAGADAD